MASVVAIVTHKTGATRGSVEAEERWITVGLDAFARVLVVVYA